ncbi:MAG: Trm112 family protein [Burkholderiales bacterium]|nr:Trm112 family protein [Burkholderiales bacterium]
MDARLLDVLVCPLCKGPLVYEKTQQELICYGDKLAFPIRDDIPIMWADQARTLTADEIAAR